MRSLLIHIVFSTLIILIVKSEESMSLLNDDDPSLEDYPDLLSADGDDHSIEATNAISDDSSLVSSSLIDAVGALQNADQTTPHHEQPKGVANPLNDPTASYMISGLNDLSLFNPLSWIGSGISWAFSSSWDALQQGLVMGGVLVNGINVYFTSRTGSTKKGAKTKIIAKVISNIECQHPLKTVCKLRDYEDNYNKYKQLGSFWQVVKNIFAYDDPIVLKLKQITCYCCESVSLPEREGYNCYVTFWI